MMPRGIAWAGGVLIGAIVALAAYDIVRNYRAAVASTGRELDTLSRIIAEQTARSVQAVDVMLRHLAQQFHRGTVRALSADELRAHLRDQAVGLVQIDGFVFIDAQGTVRASSYMPADQESTVSVAGTETFKTQRANRSLDVFIDSPRVSTYDRQWIFPISRRLELPSGEFAGVMAARGRISYFEEFYRDLRLDAHTKVTLMHRNGRLLARHPPAPEALGKQFALPEMRRLSSPLDGVERFVAVQAIQEYPLTVIVTRDADAALAAWRAQSIGTGLRTLALAALAAALLVLLARQFGRVEATRRSLEETQNRFALAVAGSDDGIWEHDFAARRSFNSHRARELVGMPAGPEDTPLDEWLETVKQYLHPDDLARRQAAMEAHLAGKTPIYEVDVRHRLPEGTHRWVRIRGVCVRDATGKPLRMAGSISDIDARKRAEEALRASEERYQLAVAGANQGLWDWDLKSDLMFISPRAQEFMGLSASEPLRPRREWIALSTYHPDDLAAVRAAISDHIHGRTEHVVVEYRLRHGSGEWHWYRQRGVALRDADGVPYRMAGSMEDITEAKRAEAHRESLEGQLLQAKKLEAIGTLAGGIAHDFNNILAAILGYGETAQKKAPEGSPLRRDIDAVVSAGLRAKSLVARILAFSRSGIGERVPVNVQSVVVEAVDLFAAAKPAHARLERRFEAAGASVVADPTQIHQVVMNLCANAAQAMKSEGVLGVSLDVVNKAGSMAATSVLRAGRYVRLAVRDSGVGIAPHVLERIFDPFFTTREAGVGTGLGLSMVHGIVTDLGGGIEVDSRVGEGTTVTVYLPCSEASPPAQPADEALPGGAGETILLVDDEEALVRLGEEVIAGLGYEPVGFTSSAAALAAFRADPDRFDAVLSDESMPEMTGSELAREIRSIRADIPVVLMSGFVTASLTARARELGVREVLPKPLVARDIARSLAGALSP